jgi:hypothetical protein
MAMECIPQEVLGCLALSDWIYYFNPKLSDIGALTEHDTVDKTNSIIVNHATKTFGSSTTAKYFTFPSGLQVAVFFRGTRIYVVFRGTEQGRTDDMKANWGLTEWMADPFAARPRLYDPLTSTAEFFDDDKGYVHSGYWWVLKDAYAFNNKKGPDIIEPKVQIHEYVKKLVAEFLPENPTICVCGHSMGGALATIYGRHLAARQSKLKVEVFTFGAPAFGDRRFRDKCERLRKRLHITRVANRGDLVMALFPGYEHVANVTYHLLGKKQVMRYDGYTYNPLLFSVIWCRNKGDHNCSSYWENLQEAEVSVPPPPAPQAELARATTTTSDVRRSGTSSSLARATTTTSDVRRSARIAAPRRIRPPNGHR